MSSSAQINTSINLMNLTPEEVGVIALGLQLVQQIPVAVPTEVFPSKADLLNAVTSVWVLLQDIGVICNDPMSPYAGGINPEAPIFKLAK